MYQRMVNRVTVLLVMLLLTFFVVKIAENHVEQRNAENQPAKKEETISLWYNNASYEPYLQAAASAYQKEHSVRIELKKVGNLGYVTAIQEANGKKEGPDIYIVENEYLQNIVRIGAVAKTVQDKEYSKEMFCNNTWNNMEYENEIYGYPLGFDVTVLMYNKELTEKVPESFEQIMSLAKEQGILKWDTKNLLYNYEFVAFYADICGESGYETSVNLDNQKLVEAAKEYQELCECFIGENDFSYDDVKNSFFQGQLQYAIVSSDVLKIYKDWKIDTGFASLPDLNEKLKVSSFAVTDLAIVNGFSDEKEIADDFAKYLSLGMADQMYSLCGVLPLAKTDSVPEESKVFYASYESAISLPKLMSALNYKNEMKDALRKIKSGADVNEVLDALDESMSLQTETNSK
ncbi:MAG: extracellular solute-binding protein [Lachnospiraceae bacterium]|nr:extracellular solute-binding protein [Lachnospiraceae bacterium]